MLLWVRRVSEGIWNLCRYGVPAGAGLVVGTVRNRRDVLCEPILFTILFTGWAWTSGQPESVEAFSEQLHQNSKIVRIMISLAIVFIMNNWAVIKGLVCFS